jgi:hypothetical protein
MMFNKHVAEELSAYYHQELTAEAARHVAEHLLSCRKCRDEYEQIKLGINLAERLPRVSAPASMWSEIEALLDDQARNPKAREAQARAGVSRPLFARYRYAAAIMLAIAILGIAVAVYYYNAERSSPQTAREGLPPVEAPSPLPPSTAPPKETSSENAKQPAAPSLTPSGPSWEVERLDGTPRVGSNAIAATGRLGVGQWLETDGASRARVSVGEIGHVEVDRNTRIRLVEARANEHRLALARGRLQAQIYAPPRLFFVNTPSAVAVDYGCAYTLEVDDRGRSLLHVTSGWVALVLKGRESMVPAGGACVTRPGIGPGTPYFEDASKSFLDALTRFDFEKGGLPAINVLLAEARVRDTLTLWHLLARVNKGARAPIFERIAALVPPPEGVTKEGVINLNQRMLNLWKDELEWNW